MENIISQDTGRTFSSSDLLALTRCVFRVRESVFICLPHVRLFVSLFFCSLTYLPIYLLLSEVFVECMAVRVGSGMM